MLIHGGRQDEGGGQGWYDLFSRAARDWLRHNEKVREAVRGGLPDLISEAGILTGSGGRTVQVPVRLLEHYRFTLREADTRTGVGQGEGEPGDILRPGDPTQGRGGRKGSGEGGGGIEMVIELKVDDIVDWLWEELQLPNLRPKDGKVEEDDYIRSGWDRRGARARLDRRRSLKEAIKRRSVASEGPMFTDDDLRYRQLVRKPRPSTDAALIMMMDVSSSVSDADRRLAKTFFFWALQGLRRQYRNIDTVFIAHTTEAWEFSEEEFFQVAGQGGTVASSAFGLAEEVVAERFNPERYNLYLFYASDGENARSDEVASMEALYRLVDIANFIGYVETGRGINLPLETETGGQFQQLAAEGLPAVGYPLRDEGDVWKAIRAFFRQQQAA